MKCRNCVVISRKEIIVDGVKTTTKCTRLCPAHLLQHLTEYSTDMDDQSPMDDLNPLLDSFFAMSSPVDLTPPSYLDPGPLEPFTLEPFTLEPFPLEPFPLEPFLLEPFPLQLPDTTSSSREPAKATKTCFGKLSRPRKRRHSIVCIDSFMDEYTTILQGSQRSTIEECCKSLGVGKTQFYERRWVAELFIVNSMQFESLQQRAIATKMPLKEVSKRCKHMLAGAPPERLEDLRRNGKLIRA